MKKITSTITDDELRAIVRENAVAFKAWREENRKAEQKNDAAIEKLTANVNELAAKLTANVNELTARLTANVNELTVNINRLTAEMTANVNDLTAKMTANVNNLTADIDAMRDTYGDRLGEIAELVVAPGIRPVMKKLGHVFDGVVPNKRVKKPDGKFAFEIDLFLDNGKEAMAVEVKSRLATSGVDGHIRQLKRIRRYEDSLGIKNKTLYGAIVGIIIDKKVREYALSKGLYLLEIVEDENRLNPIAPPAGQLAAW